MLTSFPGTLTHASLPVSASLLFQTIAGLIQHCGLLPICSTHMRSALPSCGAENPAAL
eukprot:NODE_1128_length_666_cov_723.685575_g698_i1.p3 GENE.NODE_1128_length_666_cov_723.685575_g698_i1~~NODE_1128_length_666_cov_723.685575_g698_i1.p3  ORF type:complete len:58 (-),score=0.60 NODE_1128_length_666_cov_723.685575_g698_i1:203-376(-)